MDSDDPEKWQILQSCVKQLINQGQRELWVETSRIEKTVSYTRRGLKERKAHQFRVFAHLLATEPKITPLKIYFCYEQFYFLLKSKYYWND